MSNILLAAAVLPIIGLCSYINKKDTNQEPFNLLAKIFGFGFLSAIPVVIVELLLENVFPTEDVNHFLLLFINVFMSVALVEEGFKWIVTKKFGYDNKEFDEIYDVIVYSVFASLGFACIENILYVFSNGLGNAILRALLSIPGHTCFAVLMGIFLAKAKVNHLNSNMGLYRRNIFFSIFVPALAHTFYDTFLFYAAEINSYAPLIFFFAFYIAMLVVCFETVKKTSKMQQNLYHNVASGAISQPTEGVIEYHNPSVQEIHFCPLCGKPVKDYTFCPSCGLKLK